MTAYVQLPGQQPIPTTVPSAAHEIMHFCRNLGDEQVLSHANVPGCSPPQQSVSDLVVMHQALRQLHLSL